MLRTHVAALLAALLCLSGIPGRAAAAEVDCDSIYCFSQEDFSGDLSLNGICITDLPENGAVYLGSRILRSGDILTAEQASRMTFAPVFSEADQVAEVGYLPIYENHVAENVTMTIAIRGKEDQAPAAQDFALETYKNLPNTGKLKAADPEGQVMTYSIIRQPKRGTVTISQDGSFTYTPKKNKVGIDSFVYTAADPAGNVSREATVTITILKPTEATQYTDTLGKDCRFAAEWMKHTGIFVGENLGEHACFGPEKEVTRGEFVAMLVKALDIPAEETVTHTGFADEIPQWLQPYVAAAMRAGLTEGLNDQKVFGAEEIITGAEAARMVGNALNRDSVETFSNLTEGTLNRREAAQILYQAAKQNQAVQEGTLH